MVTFLAVKAFLQFWGIKALAFLQTVPYKKQILLGVVVLLVFLGAVRYCSKKNEPDYTIQSGSVETQQNEDRRKKELGETLEQIEKKKTEQDERIRELERIVEQLQRSRPRNTTAEQLEKKAKGK
jgi:TolA-binding protein